MNFRSPHVRPLAEIVDKGRTLQVLLDGLVVVKKPGGGIHVEIAVRLDLPAITGNAGKEAVRAEIDPQEGQAFVERLSRLRLGAAGERLEAKFTQFALRHASAGVLPILARGGADLIALFHRDIHPEGWNIANGGSTEVREFGDVVGVMLREFAEEFLLLDAAAGRLLGAAAPEAASEAERAQSRLAERAGRPLAFETFRVGWGMGPDSLAVRLPDQKLLVTEGLWISVNAADFGIECTRLARLEFSDGLFPVDGELARDALLDRPIGLFSRAALKQRDPRPLRIYRSGVECFRPESVLESRAAAFCPVVLDLAARLF